ncbi:chromate transporter [Clostridium sp. MCC353]|uniref:chromate transporter n=1 Tax=Clostridium sp. MCC353 TaxID=2592646 RepID=UPI001C01EE80|nr:chromate transporter [Clostridium sp. MCC353]MBT9775248.1 chromate transporter [Clostridium sp. MCC353]
MIYISLFFAFLKIGMFAFGGAYGAIPLIQESVLAHGWMDEAMFANIIAISESTPGPIMVNAATYIGSSQAGVLGAAAATVGVVLPSFIIILIITALLHSFLKNRSVQAVLKGVKPCLMGIILAAGLFMAVKAVFGGGGDFYFDFTSFILLILLAGGAGVVKYRWKKEISPIALIVIAGVLGAVIF